MDSAETFLHKMRKTTKSVKINLTKGLSFLNCMIKYLLTFVHITPIHNTKGKLYVYISISQAFIQTMYWLDRTQMSN